MPAYISLVNFTAQGVHTVKDTVKRSKALEQAVKSAVGRVIGIWWTLGQYDVVTITEAPNDEVVMQVLLATGMQGNVRTATLRAFSADEMEKIIQKLP